MTMERDIRARLAAGAIPRQDGPGISLDWPGHPTGWWAQHVYDRAVAEMPGAGALGRFVTQSRRGEKEKPLATPSEGLAAMLAGLGHGA